MEIVVRGRNVEVPEHFRQHVEDKLSQLDRFDGKLKILRIDVELFHEKNPRQSANCQRVEITLRGKGPVVRAEACAPDFYAALDLAARKLDEPAAPRGRPPPRAPRPPHARRASGWPTTPPSSPPRARSTATASSPRVPTSPTSTSTCPGGSCARSSTRPRPMTVDQALHEMELVGHDFYLFQCADTGQPTVVYRRHAYDYGLIRLAEVPQNGEAAHSETRSAAV